MNDWSYVETAPSDRLARLHNFAMVKHQPEGEVEFHITVREYASPQQCGMHFYAEADKQTNQNTVPFTPCGWGPSLGEALYQCILAIHRFPYEGERVEPGGVAR
jgi:hypothetical protein